MEVSQQLQPVAFLLGCDEENISRCKELLIGFDSRLYAAMEHAAITYGDLAQTVGRDANLGKPVRDELQAILDNAHIDAPQFLEIMKAEGRLPSRAAWKTAQDRLHAIELRVLLVLACKRQYMWGVTDLLRFRVTPALGALRQQTEAAALLRLFLGRPYLAVEWKNILSDSDGKRFHRETRDLIPEMLDHLGLSSYYEMGSGGSLHVRLMSLVRGGPIALTQEGVRTLTVPYQEVEKQNPFRFLLSVVKFMTAQSQIVNSLPGSFPEVNLAPWTPLQMQLSIETNQFWSRLRETFPNECNELDASKGQK